MKKYQLKGLQEEIKAAAADGRAFNARIQAASGPERHALRLEKGSLGHAARYLLLAYALLRGVPYGVVERRCGEQNNPYSKRLHREACRFCPETTVEACERWLERPAEPVQVAPAAEAAQ